MIQQDEIKTKTSTRVSIGIIAAAMIASFAALYFGMVVNYDAPTEPGTLTSEEQNEFDQLLAAYNDELEAISNELSNRHFAFFSGFRSEVRAFNAASITELGTRDLHVGEGREIGDPGDDLNHDVEYAAFYIGFCADESIFDSSFDDPNNPSRLMMPLEGTPNLIEGWLRGIVGMRIGGVREISMPGDLAYGQSREICGGLNSPLRFIIMLIERPELPEVSERLWELYMMQQQGMPF